MNKSVVGLVQVACMLSVLIFLTGPFWERYGEGQPIITSETNDGAQEPPEAEPTSTPEQLQPQQSTPGVKRMSQTLDYAHFIPLTNSPGNQVKLLLNYTVDDSKLIGKPINAVMEVYNTNRSLIRVSSFPEPIIANQSGEVQLATTFADDKIQNIIATAIFTGPGKLVSISEPITIDLELGQITEK